ncbi:hypothetical protein [Yoonia sp. R2-816]|uniref:hypothetical protein n=1 Tax=Yoonia sp. R2-816 TaxID=3342638 RepID=UPI00372BBE0D
MGGIIVLAISAYVFIRALMGGNTIKIIFAGLFVAFALLLSVGGVYLRYLVETSS